ncbi:hypothetical protein ACWEQA_05785 [Nocardia sp. NPDC004085]
MLDIDSDEADMSDLRDAGVEVESVRPQDRMPRPRRLEQMEKTRADLREWIESRPAGESLLSARFSAESWEIDLDAPIKPENEGATEDR